MLAAAPKAVYLQLRHVERSEAVKAADTDVQPSFMRLKFC